MKAVAIALSLAVTLALTGCVSGPPDTSWPQPQERAERDDWGTVSQDQIRNRDSDYQTAAAECAAYGRVAVYNGGRDYSCVSASETVDRSNRREYDPPPRGTD